jgi:uncharacterized membrane protein (DUF106 family)
MNDTINQTINESVVNVVTQTQALGLTFPLSGSPTLDIFLITLLVALFTTLINKYFSDQIKIKALRAEMKELQKTMREHIKNKNPTKASAIQKDIMKKNMENIKHAMNPKILLLTMVPLLIVFSFISKIFGDFGEFFTFPIFGWTFGWLGTYIIFSIICSIAMKKVLDVA